MPSGVWSKARAPHCHHQDGAHGKGGVQADRNGNGRRPAPRGVSWSGWDPGPRDRLGQPAVHRPCSVPSGGRRLGRPGRRCRSDRRRRRRLGTLGPGAALGGRRSGDPRCHPRSGQRLGLGPAATARRPRVDRGPDRWRHGRHRCRAAPGAATGGRRTCARASQGGRRRRSVGDRNHGRGKVRDALLGSVAQNTIEHASCPVAVVHPDDEWRAM